MGSKKVVTGSTMEVDSKGKTKVTNAKEAEKPEKEVRPGQTVDLGEGVTLTAETREQQKGEAR